MKLHNTRTRQTEKFIPLHTESIRLYSCGPTVYDHIHIGNLSAFIYADTLRRTLMTTHATVQHVMNFTDVDDKTIRRSQERYPELEPREALQKLTAQYSDIFLKDMQAIGNDVNAIEFISATDSIESMRQLITELYNDGFAYTTDDGVYFSIENYKKGGKKYGQLIDITTSNTSNQRINNDEYDKESIHDFALWKKRKNNEPFWKFELGDESLDGRPGWHIECSAMSVGKLGQPFDIHTGGVDLIFPHHENEIAQSTAGNGDIYANVFVHNEHLLVDGKKMSKSLRNFYTLQDIQAKGYEPLAFRIMVLQSHYRSQTNFSWDNLESAQNRLQSLRDIAVLRWQTVDNPANLHITHVAHEITKYMQDDLKAPQALAYLSTELIDKIHELGFLPRTTLDEFITVLKTVDQLFGLSLLDIPDISDAQRALLDQRAQARDNKEWDTSDSIRNELHAQGIIVRDTDNGQVWSKS